MGYKEQLSEHVERMFMAFTTPGLHICDIATGGGKSYTIGKLTCEFYPQYFDKIIILCVQNKLVVGMNQEIDRFIESSNSLIKPKDKMIIENNPVVISKAINNGKFMSLLGEMEAFLDVQKKKKFKNNELSYSNKWVKRTYEGLVGLVKASEANNNNEYIQQQIDENEANLRKSVRNFFESVTKHLERTKQYNKVSVSQLKKIFPSLVEVYPQIEYKNKRVLLMTVHKAMYGIDPIIDEKVNISKFTKKDKRTLIIFDESDQAAVAMRNTIIDQAMEEIAGNRRFSRGYNGYLQYKSLLESPEHLSMEYYGKRLEDCIKSALSSIQKRWEDTFENIKPYKNIFLSKDEDIENYRRGVFFSGPIMRLNVSQANDNTNSYVCYKKGTRHFTLVHSADKESLKEEYEKVVALEDFLSLCSKNITDVKTKFRKLVTQALDESRRKYNEEVQKVRQQKGADYFMGYPTNEREVHTLFSRFETALEFQFEQQLLEYITNRKNVVKTKDENPLSLPDYTVYTQGVRLYQEEVDERDNQHRVKLSCREINNTPEKILLDLTYFDNTSVVLCSATASCNSVVSNFDIRYLRDILGTKVKMLPKADRIRFDELSSLTYPQDHHIEVLPIKHFNISTLPQPLLPQRYREMFSQSAQEEGLADKWFETTYKILLAYTEKKKAEEVSFPMYRLLQFIEAYHWFIHHNDVRSMIFFQNRTGDKDKPQIHLLSSLIDGSYTEMPSQFTDTIPTDWENKHIRISKDWEEVNVDILRQLSLDKEAKIMLVSAYGSFKAGTNMQYDIPEGLDYLSGDNWNVEGERQKKDWDAVYLQSPTGYLMMNDDGNVFSYEKSLYNAMLTLMMLYERNYLSKSDVRHWMYQAFANTFYFSEKTDKGIAMDKSAWAQTIVEQAVGRLCRTRNKPHTTHILYDESMVSFFHPTNLEKSLTKEFKVLADKIVNTIDNKADELTAEETILYNSANEAQARLRQVRKLALRYCTPSGENADDIIDDEDYGEIPYEVRATQRMNQAFKRTIISKPVINNIDELTEEDKYTTFISKCYGRWQRNSDGGFSFFYDNERKRIHKSGMVYPISPSHTRLDRFMKNDVIRKHFEKEGFATEWKQGDLILHPEILAHEYAGEIGEEAFKAILLYYTDLQESQVRHLEGKQYELADFVILNPDVSYRVAIDVKNMKDNYEGKFSLAEIRNFKRHKLGCELLIINLIDLETESNDIREICGLIDKEGHINQKAISILQQFVNNDNRSIK